MRRFIACLSLIIWNLTAFSEDLEIRITEEFNNTPLKEVLTVLRDNYDLRIAYSDRLIKGKVISVKIENLTVTETFELVLGHTSLTYESVPPDAIIIKKSLKEETLYDIIGEIVDAETGEHLPFAYVSLPNHQRTVTTNEDGFFSIQNISEEEIRIRTSYLGYKDSIFTLPETDFKKRLIIPISRSFNTLEEIIISDPGVEDFEFSDIPGTISINPKFASQIPETAEKDVFRMMQMLPGISGTNELSSRLFVNGGTANQNMVLFDGFTIYHMDHFFGYFSAINPLAVQSVRLFKGGFDAKYGGRSSSIVEFTGKDGNETKLAGNASVNLLSANISLEVPINDKTTAFFSGRKSYMEVFSSTLFDRIIKLYENDISETSSNDLRITNESFEPEFTYSDLNFKVSTQLGLKNNLSISVYDSNDLLNYEEGFTTNYMGDTSVMVDKTGLVNWGNIGSSVKLSTLWNSRHYTNFLTSFSYYKSRYNQVMIETYEDETQFSSITDEDNMIQDISFKVDHSWKLNSANRLELGLQLSRFHTEINSLRDEEKIVDQVQQGTLSTFYIQNHFEPKTGTRLTTGVRTNYLSSKRQVYFEPRASFSYDLGNNFTLQAATGIYKQFVNQVNTENALEGSRDLWVLADEDIPVQSAIHIMAGLQKVSKENSVSLNLFYKDFEGLTDYAFREGDFLTEYTNYNNLFFEGSGQALGLEVMLKKQLPKYTGWVSYTVSEVKYTFPDLNQNQAFYADHDQTHEINIFSSYRLGKFELFGTWYFGSGKPYTQFSIANTPNERQDGVLVILPDSKNNSRLPTYHRLDIGVNYRVKLKNAELNVAANIFNLYDRENVYDRGIEVLPSQRRGDGNRQIKEYDILLMGRTPSVSVHISF